MYRFSVTKQNCTKWKQFLVRKVSSEESNSIVVSIVTYVHKNIIDLYLSEMISICYLKAVIISIESFQSGLFNNAIGIL